MTICVLHTFLLAAGQKAVDGDDLLEQLVVPLLLHLIVCVRETDVVSIFSVVSWFGVCIHDVF